MTDEIKKESTPEKESKEEKPEVDTDPMSVQRKATAEGRMPRPMGAQMRPPNMPQDVMSELKSMEERVPVDPNFNIENAMIDPNKLDAHIHQIKLTIIKIQQNLTQAQATFRALVALKQGMIQIFKDVPEQNAVLEKPEKKQKKKRRKRRTT